ncbi:MAG TPA: 3-hydroxyacyl-CoA dehydrogenase NAD-binding domain-containing protein [Longimicrobiales bacterium]|nr:3-hydroxyacyl-CoA dehydrogenase NAD-binding domain-containing protein [Longimicrobiales bacterium]
MSNPRDRAAESPTFDTDEEGVGWITFDDPGRSLNVLTEGVMRRLGEALDEARAAAREGRIQALVLRSGKPSSFIAGADIDAIASIEDPAEAEAKIRMGQAVFNDLAAMSVPTVAAVHGACVGGGLELALACRHRVLSDAKRTSLQLPEVMLGILPAWGGTTRLPRLVGLQASLDMLLTGRKVDARKAKRMGIATEILPADLFDSKVRDFARALPSGESGRRPGPRERLARAVGSTAAARALMLGIAHRKVMSTTRGHYPAPLRILEILRKHAGGGIEESLAAEARAAAELVVSPVCKNLIHVYFLREAARKGAGLRSTDETPRPIRTLGVLGAGVMGGGIAHVAAGSEVRVYMKDIRHEAVTSGLKHARSRFDRAVERRRLTRREAAQRMELIAGGLDYHGISAADLVVEAVVERMDVKLQVLAEAERHVSEECILATNTSSLSVDTMAEALESPDRFGGLHFFNPVDRMPLVEVVRGSRTSEKTVAALYDFTLRLGKVPVVVRDGPGFLVNRILGPYLNEAGFLLGDGASIEDIDRAAADFGMPMGPLRLIDEVGIDVSRHAGAALHEALGDRLLPSPVLVALGGTERLGKKGGVGFYRYENGKEKEVDASVYDELGSVVPPRREVDQQKILMRLLIAMINEATRLLDEGIARSASDVDLAMIMGTGFPPFRGGLLRFADTLHPRALLEHASELRHAHGDRFEPPRLLDRLAEEDRGFYAAFPANGVA